MLRSDRPRTFLNEPEKRQIVDAIKAAESKTSAEIRVHLERRSKADPVSAGRREFDILGMQHTADRNGVLIFLAVRDREFAIVGDVGLNGKVDEAWWQGLRDRLAKAFQEDKFGLGLADAITEIGGKLASAFPHRAEDKNELPDTVSIGRDT